MAKIIECVPNFSEGRDMAKLEKILDCFRGKTGVKLLDYSSDYDHNRTVVTVLGDTEPLKNAMVAAMGVAAELIDLNHHVGEHPRMGATDVVPFIPIKNATMDECVQLAKDVAKEAAEKYGIPCFLYEKAASTPERENLAKVRKGQFEGMAEKMQLAEWKPDFGPTAPHKTAGATAVGARMPLVAFNVNLHTTNFEIADKIAKKVRFIGGGLRYCKAIGIDLSEKGMMQVSMNMTDFTKTSLYQSYEMIKMEAKRYGISVAETEIIGLTPLEAMVDTAVYYLGITDFKMDQVLETRLME